mgnify:CR=1 FL=1
MCIRDSFYIIFFNRELSAIPLPGEQTPAPAALYATPDNMTCLLYTSDAADERSSVDLGGRRIIKKKTKNIITTSHQLHIKNQNTIREIARTHKHHKTK